MCAIIVKASWFELCFVRLDTCKLVQGNIVAIICALMRTFFDDASHHMANSGMTLDLSHDGSKVKLFMTMGSFIADEAALHAVFCCKGSSGLKPCLLCQNIFNFKEGRGIVESDPTGFAQHHTVSDVAKLVLHTTATIAAVIARLRVAYETLNTGSLKELQTRLGWTHVPGSVMFDNLGSQPLLPTEHAMYDWMHIFFVSGVFNVHVGQLMAFLHGFNIKYSMIHTYLQEFHWPAQVGSLTGKDACCPKRAKSSWTAVEFRVTASEGLSLYPILANFMQALIANADTAAEVRQHVMCFLSLVSVVELIRRSGRGTVLPAQLTAALGVYLDAFRVLYCDSAMIIKFHYTLHLPMYLQRYGMLPSCFVHERKHRLPKRFANEVKNTKWNWDASVLREVTCFHLCHLDGIGALDVSLTDARPCKKHLQALLQQEFNVPDGCVDVVFATGREARFNQWEKCSRGDLCMVKSGDGVVIGRCGFHASVSCDGHVDMVSSFAAWHIESQSDRAWKCSPTERQLMVLTQEVMCTLTWAGSDGLCTVLKPTHVSQ